MFATGLVSLSMLERLRSFFQAFISNPLAPASFSYSRLFPLLCELMAVGKSTFPVYVILFCEQVGHVVYRKLFAVELFPQIGSCLVHAYNVAEIDILLAFGNDDVLAADVS